MHPIVLAYIGDSVLEVLARQHIVLVRNIIKPNVLQAASIEYVSAKAQAAFMDYALKKDIFTEEELSFYRRGKNARDTRILKNTSPLAHRKSTGFEAVLGHLHIIKNEERINEIFQIYNEFIMNNDTNLK